MTVSQRYAEHLSKITQENIRIQAIPCAVDPELFKFNERDRARIRDRLEFDDNYILGIYVGKFGGLYLDPSDLVFLNHLKKLTSKLGLIFLTPGNREQLQIKLNQYLSSDITCVVKYVDHKDVPVYLSGSDFALSLNKYFTTGKYLSPVKHGEYWANGLPILMTEGIGDESEFLEKEEGGVIFNNENSHASIEKLKEILEDPDHRNKIPEIAKKYRSFEKVRKAYIEMVLEK